MEEVDGYGMEREMCEREEGMHLNSEKERFEGNIAPDKEVGGEVCVDC